MEVTIFLLKYSKTLDANFVQKYQKCQICVENLYIISSDVTVGRTVTLSSPGLSNGNMILHYGLVSLFMSVMA